jgi:type I restriction enzyme S subunit
MEGARVNQHVCIIRSTQVRPEFLASYLASPQVQDAIVQGNYGVTREALTKTQVMELPVPVPSDSEQDALASLIARLTDNRSKALGHLKVARQAVESFLPAVLAAAHVEACLSDDSGTEIPLAELLREPLKNGYSAKPVNHETPFRVLTLTATTSGWFDGRYFKYTEEGFAADSPFWLSPGDIVVQRGNTAEYVGMPALYDGPTNEFLYPDLMIRVRVHSEIDPRFVWYMLLAPQARKFLTDRATGSAGNMPKINQAILNMVPVPLPPLETRQKIVRELDRAVLLSNAIGKRLGEVTRSVERSSQAVLGKAFRGELRPARSNAEIIIQLDNA